MTPLSGLKVLDISRVLAGPWAGQTLADLGANVIKVESPAGDDTRRWGEPVSYGNTAAYFHTANRGKRSIALDFRKAEDLAVLHALVREADVLIENFKVGGLAKYGLDYDSLQRENPRLIYCSITGFGQDGPYAPRAGYDFIIQGMGGMLDITGEPDGPPIKPGIALADLFTGVYGVIAIQAALLAREKTGKGQHIDMALLDTQVAVLSNQASSYLMTGEVPHRMGNTHPSIVPYQVFDAADAPFVIACGNDGQFAHLCTALGVDFHRDARFVTNDDRIEHREILIPMLSKVLAALPRDKILQRLENAGVPAGPINTVAETFADPQVIHRGLKNRQGDFDGVRNPIRFSDLEMPMDKAPPALDADGPYIRKNLWNTET